MLEHLHQLSVHAYYAGELDAGRRACERMLAMRLTPEREALVRRNRTWYTQRLAELVVCRMERIDIPPAQPGWSLFNPTIVATEDGYAAVVRSSNYRIEGGRYVIPLADGELIRTENMLVRLDDALNVTHSASIQSPAYRKSGYPVDGLEDCRLNSIDGRLSVSATVRNLYGRDGTCRIATARLRLCSLAPGFFDIVCCGEPIPGRHEKNWAPITGTGRFVYSCWHDGHVATASRVLGRWGIESHAKSPEIARGWRGGSQLVDLGDGHWLALVHEVADDTGGRIYEHRFVLFKNDEWRIVGWSPAFAFRETRAIEFAAGLARRGDQLVATFGVRDAEAWMAEMSLAEVLAVMGGNDG